MDSYMVYNTSTKITHENKNQNNSKDGSFEPRTVIWIALLIICSLTALLVLYCILVRRILHASRPAHKKRNGFDESKKMTHGDPCSNSKISMDTPAFCTDGHTNDISSTIVSSEELEVDSNIHINYNAYSCMYKIHTHS